MEGKPEVIADKKQYGELYAIFKEIQGLLRHGVAVVKISTQFSLWSSALLNFFLHSQTGLNGDMETMTNSKSHVNKWKSGAVPTKIGRRTIHPKTHDLFSMMVPDAADYMGRINISDINEGHTCY
ncbi:hypothetical protein YC2023_012196 [Brassica napus]